MDEGVWRYGQALGKDDWVAYMGSGSVRLAYVGAVSWMEVWIGGSTFVGQGALVHYRQLFMEDCFFAAVPWEVGQGRQFATCSVSRGKVLECQCVSISAWGLFFNNLQLVYRRFTGVQCWQGTNRRPCAFAAGRLKSGHF